MIVQEANVTFNVTGDGISTVQYLDLTKDVEAPSGTSSFTHTPAGELIVVTTPTLTVSGTNYTSTVQIIGNLVIITWSSPLPNGLGGGASIIIGY